VCACPRERRANIVFNGMAQPQRSSKRSAMENDFGVKSVGSPGPMLRLGGANQRASMTGEERD